MSWKFGKRSKQYMEDMHPKLEAVFYRALELSPYDFGVIQVLRTHQQQVDNIAKGVSWTMDTKHFRQKDGWVHAGDFVVYKDGVQTWEEGVYRKVMQAFVTAAIEYGIQIKLGGLFESVFDGGHVELVLEEV